MSDLEKLGVLKIILKSSKLYKENLLNKNVLFIYQKQPNQFFHIETVYEPRHFQHLTGTKISNMSTVQFFDKCLNNVLSIKDFELADDGTTLLKMNVICDLMQIQKVAKMIGDYNGYNTKLYTDKIIGNTIGCMGFVNEDRSDYLVPNTLLEYDIRKIIKPSTKLMAIYIKQKKDKQYNHLGYLTKGIVVENIKWTKEIENKIDKNNLIIDYKHS